MRYYPSPPLSTEPLGASLPAVRSSECLDVRYFGTGYWIGTASSTAFGLTFSLLQSGVHLGEEFLLPVFVLAQAAMAVGFVTAQMELRQGLRAKDKNAVIGGLLGSLLCLSPLVLVICLLDYKPIVRRISRSIRILRLSPLPSSRVRLTGIFPDTGVGKIVLFVRAVNLALLSAGLLLISIATHGLKQAHAEDWLAILILSLGPGSAFTGGFKQRVMRSLKALESMRRS